MKQKIIDLIIIIKQKILDSMGIWFGHKATIYILGKMGLKVNRTTILYGSLATFNGMGVTMRLMDAEKGDTVIFTFDNGNVLKFIIDPPEGK